MAASGVPPAAAGTMAALLVLAAAAAADSYHRTALYLFQPLCDRTCIKQTYTTCRCMDVQCSGGPYRYKFVKDNISDAARAYLFTEPGCNGDVTVVRRTTGDCRNFRFRSVKICPTCDTPSPEGAAAAAEE